VKDETALPGRSAITSAVRVATPGGWHRLLRKTDTQMTPAVKKYPR
jgi:hypothetical protein